VSLAYAPPGASYTLGGSALGGFGLIAPPVRLPDYLNVPAQWSAHPHLSGFVLGALAMYALPPFLGGVWQGAGDELRDRAKARRRADARRRRR